MSARLRFWAVLAAVIPAAIGCSKDDPAPTAVAPPPPAAVTAVVPDARSTRVPMDTAIHADFSVELDPGSIGPTTVFLKVDTRRYEAEYSWDSALRRLTIVPREELRIARTYTIEITPQVKLENGESALPGGYFWQFTTTTIRPPLSPRPPDGTTLESPFVRLHWAGTEAEAGHVVYEVFFGPDSAAVADRSVPGADSDSSNWIPRARWELGATTWWSVRAINLDSGEVVESPTWRFETLPASTPVVDVPLTALEWGWISSTSSQSRCFDATVRGSATIKGGWRWQLPPATVKFADAELVLTGSPGFPLAPIVGVRAAASPWNACAMSWTGSPAPIGPVLATGVRGTTSNQYRFHSDAFTAHLEAAAREGNVWGYLIDVGAPISFSMTSAQTPGGGAVLARIYQLPPVPAPPVR